MTLITDIYPRSPISGKDPARRYWGIDQSIRYGTSPELILDTGSGIVDTGTTLILLATSTSFY